MNTYSEDNKGKFDICPTENSWAEICTLFGQYIEVEKDSILKIKDELYEG